MKSIDLHNIKKKFQILLTEKSEKEGIEHDAYILMSAFLSEIDKIQDEFNTTRKDLAENIKVSPSYLTQVFRGNKPLNFITLAKMQRALGIKFKITAHSKSDFKYQSTDTQMTTNVFLMQPVKKSPRADVQIIQRSELSYS